MRKLILSCLLASVLAAPAVFAQEQEPSPELTRLHGTGAIDAVVVTLPFDREVVEGLLPPGLELADTESARLPVILMFGRHRDVHPAAGTWSEDLPVGLNYHEFILGVPFVRAAGGSTLYTFMPRLFLDERLPILLGLPYGFAKKISAVVERTGEYQVFDLATGNELVNAEWMPTGDFQNPDEVANFGDIQRILALPMIGKTVAGPLVCSDFDWNLGGARSIQPVNAAGRIDLPFLPGLPRLQWSAPGIDERPFGAFRVRTQWTLSLPRPCRG